MSVRLRRLQADYEQLREGLQGHPAISIRGVSGSPPERYQIEYKLRSLSEGADGQIRERCEHVAEIYLTLSYPRQAPQCRMLTPVFHPNIAPHAICIGDHWAAGESLLQLITRVGEMLAYQSYNTKSPLNGAAARWVDENQDQVPTDPRDLTPQRWTESGRSTTAENQCANCSASGVNLTRCVNGHVVCASCMVECTRCNKSICLLCRPETCSQCGRLICTECRVACPQCHRSVCREHLVTCAVCGVTGCADCCLTCAHCSRTVCLTHVTQCEICRTTLCAEHSFACAGCGKRYCAEHYSQQYQRCTSCLTRAAQTTQAPQQPRPAQPQPRPAQPQPTPSQVYQCQSCQTQMRIGAEHLGKSLKCPTCGTIFRVG
jgi:ubiquitin-protein ligase